jgi:hypothetical protein
MTREYEHWSSQELEEHRQACIALARDLTDLAEAETSVGRARDLQRLARRNRQRAGAFLAEIAAR